MLNFNLPKIILYVSIFLLFLYIFSMLGNSKDGMNIAILLQSILLPILVFLDLKKRKDKKYLWVAASLLGGIIGIIYYLHINKLRSVNLDNNLNNEMPEINNKKDLKILIVSKYFAIVFSYIAFFETAINVIFGGSGTPLAYFLFFAVPIWGIPVVVGILSEFYDKLHQIKSESLPWYYILLRSTILKLCLASILLAIMKEVF